MGRGQGLGGGQQADLTGASRACPLRGTVRCRGVAEALGRGDQRALTGAQRGGGVGGGKLGTSQSRGGGGGEGGAEVTGS